MSKLIVEMVQRLAEVIPAEILSDLGLYIALGLTGIVFICTLIAGLASSGELGKFKSCANRAVKNPTPQNITECMQKMPVRVKKQYKRAILTGTKPSDIVSIDAAVNTPYRYSSVSKMSRRMAAGATVAAAIGVGFSAVMTGEFGAVEALVVLMTAVAGGIFTLICTLISSSAYKSAVKAYNALTDVLDNVSGEPARQQAPQMQPEHDYTEEQPHEEAPIYTQEEYYRPEVEEKEEPAQTYVEPQSEEPEVFAEPHVEQSFAASVEEEPEEEQVVTVEEPRRNDNEEAAKAAAQKRLEELRAQREAQIKAQREAAAQARATQQANTASSVSAEDVIERIEQIDRDGAPLPVMKEVAMLLQKERAKPENKTPEQQKKLNEALSKLLKAMSAANKR